jgi:hypothetical protein
MNQLTAMAVKGLTSKMHNEATGTDISLQIVACRVMRSMNVDKKNRKLRSFCERVKEEIFFYNIQGYKIFSFINLRLTRSMSADTYSRTNHRQHLQRMA